MADISRKQGDTLLAYLKVRDPDGNAVDLAAAGIVARSQIKDARGDLYDVDATATTRGQEPALRLLFDTLELDPGQVVRWDVQCRQGSVTASTPTVLIEILEDVTEEEPA